MVNRKNTVLLAPVESARGHTVQERSRLKGGTLVDGGHLDRGSLVQFTGSSFQFQFLHGTICGDWTGASKTVY